MSEHVCDKPPLAFPISTRLLPWECAICGRVWSVAVGGSMCWWEETRGPRSARIQGEAPQDRAKRIGAKEHDANIPRGPSPADRGEAP